MHDETSNLALIVSCFDWYKGRIEAVRDAFLARSYRVKILMSDFDHMRKERMAVDHPDCELIKVPAYSKNISLARIRSHMSFASQVNRVLNQEKPQVVYLLVPPNKTADYCRQYRNRHQDTRLIVDVIDLWPESLLGTQSNKVLALQWKRYRDRALERADYVFTECDLYRYKLGYVLDPKRSSTLYLYGKTKRPASVDVRESLAQTANSSASNSITFGYLGSINNIIDIDGICELMKAFVDNGISTQVKIVGDGESKDQFLGALEQTGCIVSYYGPIYDDQQKAEILGDCNYGLNMMKDTVSVGLSIKSIDYLSMGIPLANSIKGDTWRLVEKYRIGQNIGESIDTSIIQRMFETRGLSTRQCVSQCYQEFFTREAFNKQLLQGLDSIHNVRYKRIG